jgi:potassium efflux system protein
MEPSESSHLPIVRFELPWRGRPARAFLNERHGRAARATICSVRRICLFLSLLLPLIGAAPTTEESATSTTSPVILSNSKEVSELAEANALLRTKIQEVEEQTADLNAGLRRATSVYQQTKRHLDLTREQLGVEGMGSEMGEVLREERRSLVPQEEYRREIQELRHKINASRLEQLRIEHEREALADVDQAIAQRLRRRSTSEVPATQRSQEEKDLGALLHERRALLDKLADAYAGYVSAGTALSHLQQDLAGQSIAYGRLLDERLLWIPNASAVGRNWIGELVASATWLADPAAWRECLLLLRDRSMDVPLIAIAVLFAFAAFLILRRRLCSRLQNVGSLVQRDTSDGFFLTVRALILTLLITTPWPLLLWFIGWRLGAAGATNVFAAAVSAGFLTAAMLLLKLLFLRRVCAKNGLADAHFHWPGQTRNVLRRNLAWLIAIGLPVTFIVAMTEATGNDTYTEGLGRLCFCAGSIALAVFALRILRPKGGALEPLLARYQGRRIWRMRYVWFIGGALVPLILGFLAMGGYYYAASAIESRLFRSMLVLVGAILVHNIVVRWLIVAQRHVAMRQAHERREAAQTAKESKVRAQAAGEAAPQTLEVPLVNIAAVSEQARALLRFVIGLLIVIGLWAIWADLVPALGIFNEITLWQYSTWLNGEQRLVPITLASLGLCLLIIVLTAVAVRNLAGVLEIALLQRLSLDAGLRYAISRVSRYVIVSIGIVAAFNAIGVGWSQVQWLVAAISVGLGFGLQEIFANFVAGIIVLFERPIRVGDVVTLGDMSGTVSRIRMRATVLNDADNREVIVPNRMFITDRLINWTLSDSVTRLIVKVGIGYGSDTTLAQKLMLEVAASNPQVMSEPAPAVFLVAFGDSSLDYEVRVFVKEPAGRAPVASGLHMAIAEALKEHDIQIPFPQRDLHIKDADGLLLPCDAPARSGG